jgi:hypothetical protein
MGSSTSSLDSVSTTFQGCAENASAILISDEADKYEWPNESTKSAGRGLPESVALKAAGTGSPLAEL